MTTDVHLSVLCVMSLSETVQFSHTTQNLLTDSMS